jgi:hypothetical protein
MTITSSTDNDEYDMTTTSTTRYDDDDEYHTTTTPILGGRESTGRKKGPNDVYDVSWAAVCFLFRSHITDTFLGTDQNYYATQHVAPDTTTMTTTTPGGREDSMTRKKGLRDMSLGLQYVFFCHFVSVLVLTHFF